MWLLVCLCLLVSLSSCGALDTFSSKKDGRLRLVCWNLQTFFDARWEGGEYEDFVRDKHWGEQAYGERLARLVESLACLKADVLVLEELESEAVLQDIANFLCSKSLLGRRYRWAAFAKESGAALGCAVLSRYPLDSLSCHALDVRSPSRPQKPGLRPLMRLRVIKKDRSFFLLVNHWKSMSGGRDESEVWRDAQEGLLGNEIAELRGLPAVACGDFNRDVADFALGEGGLLLLRSGDAGSVPVRSPWFLPDGSLVGPGSYYYKEAWSRIDGFLSAGNIRLEDFKAETEGPWCYEDTNRPKKYQVWSGRGYSDHLPISCSLVF